MPDGMPVQHTGYLPGTDKAGKDKGPEAEKEGKWVCWHDSCADT